MLETEKLHCVEVDVFLESQTALVRSDCVVELDAEAAVYVIIAVVVHPGNAEHDLSVRLDKALQNDVLRINCSFCSIAGAKEVRTSLTVCIN